MDNPFIETVTTKRIKEAYFDGDEVGGADVKIVPNGNTGIELVVGASYKDAVACYFDKKALAGLIKILQEVHDVLEN